MLCYHYPSLLLDIGSISQHSEVCCYFQPEDKALDEISDQEELGDSGQMGMSIYLRVSITGHRLQWAECKLLEQRIQEHLQGWQANGLSFMGRMTLVRSVLTSALVYLLTNTIMPIACIKGLEQQFHNFL